MFLILNHRKLEVFSASKEFVFECYRLTKSFPEPEKFGMISQTRRAALSVHLILLKVHQENQNRKENDITKLQEVL